MFVHSVTKFYTNKYIEIKKNTLSRRQKVRYKTTKLLLNCRTTNLSHLHLNLFRVKFDKCSL